MYSRWKNTLLAGLTALAFIGNARAEEVVVGIQTSETGPFAAYAGFATRSGIDAALEFIKTSNYLGYGRTIKAIYEDNGSDKTQAITLTNRFATRDKVSIMVGPVATPLALAAAPVAQQLA